jgi:HEAT repeat protein
MVDINSENTPSKVEQNIGQNLKAEGNISLSNITQISQQFVQQKLDFFELDIKKYQPSPKFTNLKITSQFIDSIKDNRLLVLGDSPNVDIATFAKYLACYWSNQQFASTTQKLVVKEWHRSSDFQSIDVEIQNTKESTVFILTQVSPQNIVGYSLQQIQQVAFSNSHYVIVTTDTPLVAWRLLERAKTFWHELTVEDVLDCPELVNKFTDKESIHKWYYHVLTSREQLLALGLSFFDGLFDDQFFAALEEIVESAWQRRDTTLRALDYYDLDNLRNFFNFTETNTSITFIEVRFPKQRQMLLKVAWESHRRLILAALPILVNLVKNSVRRYERELYGSPLRCDQLRRVISETISDIGLIASDAVEDTLLNIAADEDINVQAVAAQAMALWRDDNKREFIGDEGTNHHIDRQLFETLQRWQNGARARSLVDAILSERDQKESKEPVDYIRATIALTVGYAALYDPSDQLSPELLELLKHLISEQNELVRNRVFTHTLPRVILQHIVQLRDILPKLLRDIDDLVLALANSLAFAYRFRPKDVLETLHLWNNECKNQRPNRINIAQVTSREALLTTVALTYGKIECDKSIGALTPLVAVQHLKIILLEELHPRVREIALFAIGCQANRAFDQVEPELQDLVSRQISQKERQEVAEILTQIYLEQRFQLLGGEQTIEIDNKKYPVWLNSTRPLTIIEQTMVRWVKNKQNPMAQQVATNATANFVSKLEQEEERQIKQLREGRDSLETTSITIYGDPIEGGKPPQDWYFGKLIPWLATRKADNYRTAIRNLLPEGLRQYKISRDVMDFVLLQKWGNASDADVKAISEKLKSGLWLAENLVWLAPLGIGVTLTLVGVTAINLSKSSSKTVTLDTHPAVEKSSVNNQPTLARPSLPAQDDRTPNATIVGTPEKKNIRSGPGTDYKELHIAYPGDRIRVIGKSNDQGGYPWYKIYFPQSGAEGWIGAHLVQVDAGVQP